MFPSSPLHTAWRVAQTPVTLLCCVTVGRSANFSDSQFTCSWSCKKLQLLPSPQVAQVQFHLGGSHTQVTREVTGNGGLCYPRAELVVSLWMMQLLPFHGRWPGDTMQRHHVGLGASITSTSPRCSQAVAVGGVCTKSLHSRPAHPAGSPRRLYPEEASVLQHGGQEGHSRAGSGWCLVQGPGNRPDLPSSHVRQNGLCP